jgi:hypothetical protein
MVADSEVSREPDHPGLARLPNFPIGGNPVATCEKQWIVEI